MIKLSKFIILTILFLLTFTVIAQDVPDNFDIQGHRGARGLQPENTLPAIETALDLGVTTLELDMHYTLDGVVVMWHDATIPPEKCRLPDGVSEADIGITDNDSFVFNSNELQISDLTLEQVQSFICDRNPDRRNFPRQDNSGTLLAGDDYRIPTLDEVFAFVAMYAESEEKTEEQRANASTVYYNIETKRVANSPGDIGDDFDGENAGAFELAILDVIYDYDILERVIIQSFDHRSLWAIKAAEADIRIAVLTNRGRVRLESYAEQGANIWSPRHSELTQALLDEAHELGLLVIPWTINRRSDMQNLMDMGVDGLITDFPNILIDLLAEMD